MDATTEDRLEERGKGFTIFHDMFADIGVVINWGVLFCKDQEVLHSAQSTM